MDEELNKAHVDFWFGPDPGRKYDPRGNWTSDTADMAKHAAKVAIAFIKQIDKKTLVAERQNGYYWLKHKNLRYWTIGEWSSLYSAWINVIGLEDGHYSDTSFDVIGNCLTPPT